MNLKQAIKNKKLDKFIEDRREANGDAKKFVSTISSMLGKSKAVRAASHSGSSANYSGTQTHRRKRKGA